MKRIIPGKLNDIRLSSSRNINSIEFSGGVNGIVSVTKDGLPFVVLEFINDDNKSNVLKATRRYYALNMKWKGLSPRELLKHVGEIVPGKFVTLKVMPYRDVDGVLCSTYTAFIMPHENDLSVFAQLGYSVIDNDGSVLIEAKYKHFVH